MPGSRMYIGEYTISGYVKIILKNMHFNLLTFKNVYNTI